MKILIVTAEPGNYVPVELQKSAKELNVEADIINVNDCVMSEGIDSKIFLIKGKDDQKTLEELPIDAQTFIIPRLSEYHLEVKLSLFKRMELLGATLLNDANGLELCNDKLMSQVILNNCELKTPQTIVFQGSEDIELIVDQFEKDGKLKYPIIVKTLRGTHGIGVMKIDSRSSLISVAQTLLKEGVDFLLQEFIKHEQSARIIMMNQAVLAANLRGQPKEKDEFRTNSHLGSQTEPYTPTEAEVAMGVKICQAFNVNFCAIDYIKLDDQIIVLEVNGSPGLEAIQKNWPDRNLAKDVIQSIIDKASKTDAAPTELEPQPEAQPVEEPKVDQTQTAAAQELLTDVEPCIIHRIIDEPVDARIDTGAKYSSLHVDAVTTDESFVKFTRGDITFKVPLVKMIKIKNVHGGDSTPRPVIELDVSVKGVRVNRVQFTLNSRSNMKYGVLLGRTAIELLGLPVSVPAVEHPYSDESQIEVEEE